MKARGALIVFEGLDRSGKSTQAKLLCDVITSEKYRMKAELWKYPNRTTNSGKQINDYLTNKIDLTDQKIHKLFSENRWETVDEMKKKLNLGYNLIVDRYAYSGTAYSAAKKDMDFEWCKQCDTGLPKPDIVFFMDTKPDVTSKRNDFGNERYENAEFQNLVYNNFKKLFDSLTNDCDSLTNFQNIDASDTIENLHKKILDETLIVIEMCKYKNIQSLW